MRLCAATFVLGIVGLSLELAPESAHGQASPPTTAPAEQATLPADETTPAFGTPRLELSTTEWNFGTKWFGESCSTEITIKNVGDAPLKITRVRSSCGCTVAKPGKEEFLPGESDKMSISYNTRKQKRDVSQTITLYTNDPRQPRAAIRIKGEVKHVYDAKPSHRITFGRIDRSSVSTSAIELRNNMDKKVILKLRPPKQESPFDVKLEEIEAGVSYKLSATTKPPLSPGANATTVVLETGLDKIPELRISVSAYIAPRVAVTPSRLYVSPRVIRPLQRFVHVRYQAEKPVAVTEIKTSHPDLIQAELLQPEESTREKAASSSSSYKIKVSLPAYEQMPAGGGRVEIFTDDPSPEYQKLVVEIVKHRGSVRRSQARSAETPSSSAAAGDTQPEERPAEK